ncbi:hypothetical protein GGR54DRAFT_644204 [Hypoxylon sp. NC1633]|nr:hypothetical protein GGR54DRAFT_644204 [Hypoxylon sp. NC1633]
MPGIESQAGLGDTVLSDKITHSYLACDHLIQYLKSSAHADVDVLGPKEHTYICQQTLLDLLHAHSFHSLHPVCRNDAERSIEFDYAWFPVASYRLGLGDVLLQLSYSLNVAAQRPYLDAVQQSLVDALHLLHAHNISFPLSADRVQFARSCDADQGNLQSLKLFLPFNKKARWASSTLPPTWKADQLASAASIFRVPQLLIRLAAAPTLTPLDPESQQLLAAHIKEHPGLQHDEKCLGIYPITTELAHEIAYCLVTRNKPDKSCDVLDSFFGDRMPLPDPTASPHTICSAFIDLRRRAVDSERQREDCPRPDREPEAEFLLDSPAMVVRFVCCRAEIASQRREPNRREWWLTAMNLYDVFLADQEPTSYLDRVCAYDLNHYRSKWSLETSSD